MAIVLSGPLGPGLLEFNLASHLIWWVAGIASLVVLLGFAVEAWDWLSMRWRSSREGSADES
jgi:hypothetical protein